MPAALPKALQSPPLATLTAPAIPRGVLAVNGDLSAWEWVDYGDASRLVTGKLSGDRLPPSVPVLDAQGNLGIPGGVTAAAGATFGSVVDPNNPSLPATQIEPPLHSTRIYLGSAAKPAFSLNLSYLQQGIEGLRSISLGDFGVQTVSLSIDNNAVLARNGSRIDVAMGPFWTGINVKSAIVDGSLTAAGITSSGPVSIGTVNPATTPGTQDKQLAINANTGRLMQWVAAEDDWMDY